MTIQRAHAVANGLPVLVCNNMAGSIQTRAGAAGDSVLGLQFHRQPAGRDSRRERRLTAPPNWWPEVDRARIETVGRIWPFFRDRRIDAYQDLLKRYGK